jgi:hypothetical protein
MHSHREVSHGMQPQQFGSQPSKVLTHKTRRVFVTKGVGLGQELLG